MKSKRTRRRWPTEQKREIAEAVQRRLRAGERFGNISRDLDILSGTLRLWMQQFPAAQLLPVKAQRTEQAADAEVRSDLGGVISLHMPNGFRFDGLDVGDVAVLLEELR